MSAASSSGNVVRRAMHVLRREGPKSFGFRLLAACGYRRLFLLARDLGLPAQPWSVQRGIELGELGPAEVDAYLAFRRDASRAAIVRRFTLGHRCFVARRHGAVVSACWAATADAWSEYLGCTIAIAPGDVYFYDAFTAATARGLALAPAVCAWQIETFRAAGYARAVRATLPENRSALRAHAKNGFEPVGEVRRFGVGGRRSAPRIRETDA